MNARERAIKSLWTGHCTIFVRENAIEPDPATGITLQTEIAAVEDELCRVSFGSSSALGDQRGAPPLTQTITLFIDCDVPPGSKVVVTQNGVTTTFGASGVPKVFTYHREITMEHWKGWA